MKYKVGDRVLIKDWDEMEKEYGFNIDGNIDCRFPFVEGMRNYCGNFYTIYKIRCDKYYLNVHDCYPETWAFSEDMIKCKAYEFEPGELIEVRDSDNDEWQRRKFIAVVDHDYRYIAEHYNHFSDKTYPVGYKFARKIENSLDGETVEIKGVEYTLKRK